jgi:hypothetical protein
VGYTAQKKKEEKGPERLTHSPHGVWRSSTACAVVFVTVEVYIPWSHQLKREGKKQKVRNN